MAKKVVATFKSGGTIGVTKVVRMVKSKKSDSYEFKEDFVTSDKVKDFLAESKK